MKTGEACPTEFIRKKLIGVQQKYKRGGRKLRNKKGEEENETN